MYAGRNGLTRNVQAAVEYFRLGAEQHDASSHFSYGLALLKVRPISSDNESSVVSVGSRCQTESDRGHSTFGKSRGTWFSWCTSSLRLL
jgi:TPR repeat protein